MNIRVPFDLIALWAPRLTISPSCGLEMGAEYLGIPGADCAVNPTYNAWDDGNPMGGAAREVMEIDPETGDPTGRSVWLTCEGEDQK